jgi:acyl-CoA thioester hydrolase
MVSLMASEFHATRRIEFPDTDMAGIVHFSRFFVFMEAAEHEFQYDWLASGGGVL